MWLGFLVVAAITGFSGWLLGDDPGGIRRHGLKPIRHGKLSVEVMVLLFDPLTLWLGFLRIAQKAGLVDVLARLLNPLFRGLMPEVPRGPHPRAWPP